MKIGLVEVFVDDQDNARDFYIGQLGLQIKDDAPYGTGQRWLTVVSPEDPGGTELLLAPSTAPPERSRFTGVQPALRRCRSPSTTATATTSCGTMASGSSPGRRRWANGDIDAMFEDGCGNLCSLHQEGAGHG